MNNLLSAFLEEFETLNQSFNFEDKEKATQFYKKNNYLFATTSASLFRLLPQIPYAQHKSIFKKLLFNLQLLTIEEKYVELFSKSFDVLDRENILHKAQKGQPFLFCCFHTGSYSIIPALLASKNLDFGFLSNQTLTERKGKHFLEVHRKYCNKNALNSTIQLINVEENKGIWKAIRLLKEGKSLIVYADGNTGSNYSKKESQNTVKINFLGNNLLVRQGIAFLSYACTIPIIPVVSSREYVEETLSLKRKYTLLPAICPTDFVATTSEKDKTVKEKFAIKTMQKLYSILEKEVTKNVGTVSEWEGWIFVNKFFEQLQQPILSAHKTKNNNTRNLKTASYIFNEERFALIENQKITLFDKFTYRFFPVSDLLYEIIIYFSIPKKLYLFDKVEEDSKKVIKQNSNSPVSSSDSSFIQANSKLQLSKTLISVSALEKLIEKEILVSTH